VNEALAGYPFRALCTYDVGTLPLARHRLESAARSDSALPSSAIEDFLIAVHEVAANGLFHGDPPVRISQWLEVSSLTCLVADPGRGDLHPLTGLRFPEEWGPMGLWAARQLVDDLFIGKSRSGGCSVLLILT